MEGRTRYGRKELKAKGRWKWKVRFERKEDIKELMKSTSSSGNKLRRNNVITDPKAGNC